MEQVIKFKMAFLKYHFGYDTPHTATASGNTSITQDCRQYNDINCGEIV